jgi:hypothetical protein
VNRSALGEKYSWPLFHISTTCWIPWFEDGSRYSVKNLNSHTVDNIPNISIAFANPIYYITAAGFL